MVAEVQRRQVVAALAGEGVHRRVQRLGLHPVGLHDLAHRQRAGPNTREGVIAIGVGGLAGEHVAAGIEQVHRPALKSRLARTAQAVTVLVVVHVARDAQRLEVAEDATDDVDSAVVVNE